MANQLISQKSSRLVSLDGLRAISIILVMIGHLSHTEQFKKNISYAYADYFDWSDFGVHIFFVISGFLISVLLIGEEKKYASISLKNFYARRFLRIFPAYYFFLLCFYLVTLRFDFDTTSFAGPLTFTTGFSFFTGTPGWTLGHTWSLSVEEEFYILYPFFLFAIRKRTTRLFILFSGVILFPVLRAYLYHTCYPEYSYTILYRGDCIIWGCLLAFYMGNIKSFFSSNKGWMMPLVLFVTAIVILIRISSIHRLFGILTMPFSNTFQSLLACLMIINYTILSQDSQGRSFRFLNSKPMLFVGTLSYSIYLWQQFFIQPHSDKYFWSWFPLDIVFIFVAAWLSYNLIEKPFLKLRVYFTKS